MLEAEVFQFCGSDRPCKLNLVKSGVRIACKQIHVKSFSRSYHFWFPVRNSNHIKFFTEVPVVRISFNNNILNVFI